MLWYTLQPVHVFDPCVTLACLSQYSFSMFLPTVQKLEWGSECIVAGLNWTDSHEWHAPFSDSEIAWTSSSSRSMESCFHWISAEVLLDLVHFHCRMSVLNRQVPDACNNIHTMDFHRFPTWSFPATNLKVSLHHAKSFEKSSESWQVQPTVIIYCLIRQQVPGAWTHAFDSGLLRLLYKYSIIQQFASSTHARMQSACRFWQSDMFRNWNYSVNRTHLFLYNHVPWLSRKPFRV